MYIYDERFGVQIYEESAGKAWINLIRAVLEKGESTYDEGRNRLSLQNVRLKITNPKSTDEIFNKYANQENLEHMDKLMFSKANMFDFDVKPSFSPGAKSYYQRMKEGKMEEFVIKRLTFIPESKKAVIVYPTYEDYTQVLANQKDDYLPCLVAFQTRLLKSNEALNQNNTFFMRSWDIFQKAPGNISTMIKLGEKINNQLSNHFKQKIPYKILDGFITDGHIYEENYDEARELIEKVNRIA